MASAELSSNSRMHNDLLSESHLLVGRTDPLSLESDEIQTKSESHDGGSADEAASFLQKNWRIFGQPQ